ncbi:MAG: multidrug ABC transporter ATP-binding protein [Nitrospiraceae bacterium]
MTHAIKIEHLTKTFGDLRAVDDVSLTVAKGEIFGLVGPDGAGKTTIMRLLAAVMDLTSGDAWVMGKPIVRDAEAIKAQIGYMSQRFGLYADLTVEENIRFYADIYGVSRKERERRMPELLAFSNLAPFKKRQAGKLSGGMKQKLGLACVLIRTPEVLFLDEPTNGVDPVSRRDFWRILYQLLKEGITIFISTAYLDEAERCSRVALLHKGRLLACDTPDRVKTLMHGTILEVRTLETRRVAALLKDRLPGESVGLFGDRVHVVTRTPKAAEREVEQALREAGISLIKLQTVEPTLEDVFVSVLSENERSRRGR